MENVQCLFLQADGALRRWKTAQKDFLLALLSVWYADDNALFRQKAFTASLEIATPILTEIIHQGIQEGVLKTSYPDQAGEVVLYILQGLNETLARWLFSDEPRSDDLVGIQSTVDAYTDALERVLGAPPDSVHLFDLQILKEWIVS